MYLVCDEMTIYQHFRKHEHPFVDQVLSWKEQVIRNYIPYETDFLDPREQEIVKSIIGTTNEEVRFAFFGGSESRERKRAIIAPFYEEITEEAFDIVLLEATFQSKFVTLQHRDILGAFTSLGIDRKKIGDILVAENRFQLFLTSELKEFVKMNLTNIKNTTITLKEMFTKDVIENTDEWIHKQHFVSSMRLDVIVKEIYQLSRKNAVQYIQANRVKVNFTIVDDPALPILEQDLISVRGLGRSKIVDMQGKTKKDKQRLTSARLKT